MEGGVMLKEYLDFERDAGLLVEFEEVSKCYSASACSPMSSTAAA
jgi:hypothetical protein